MDLHDVPQSWHPQPHTVMAFARPEPATMLLRVLGEHGQFREGDPLPAMWHWLHFLSFTSQQDLGPDGHPANERFLPPLSLRRRMMAGGSLTLLRPFVVGGAYARRTELAHVATKSGTAGRLLFVRLQHTFSDETGTVAVEHEEAVYRDPGTQAVSERSEIRKPVRPGGEAEGGERRFVLPTDPTLLFRFSALTHNAHRIHYDAPYATQVEGHPGLVVHGPLIALAMLELARRNARAQVVGFEYRLRSPLYVGDSITASATGAEDCWHVAVAGARAERPAATGSIQFA